MTVENLADLAKAAKATQLGQMSEQISHIPIRKQAPSFGVMSVSSQDASPDANLDSMQPNWNAESTATLETQRVLGADPKQQTYYEPRASAATLGTSDNWALDPGSAAENTPLSESSSSNAFQFPYRQAEVSYPGKPSDFNVFPFQDVLETFNLPPDWNLTQELPGELDNTQVADELNILLEQGTWNNNN